MVSLFTLAPPGKWDSLVVYVLARGLDADFEFQHHQRLKPLIAIQNSCLARIVEAASCTVVFEILQVRESVTHLQPYHVIFS